MNKLIAIAFLLIVGGCNDSKSERKDSDSDSDSISTETRYKATEKPLDWTSLHNEKEKKEVKNEG